MLPDGWYRILRDFVVVFEKFHTEKDNQSDLLFRIVNTFYIQKMHYLKLKL